MTPRLGTDGNGIVYPFRGIVQGFRELGDRPERATLVYTATLVVATLATGIGLIAAGFRIEEPGTVLALALAAAITERMGVRFAVSQSGRARTEEHSIGTLAEVFAAVVVGPLAAALVGAASMLGDPELLAPRDPVRAPRLKWATYTSIRFIRGAITGIAAQAVLGAVSSEFGALVAASLVGAVVSESVDLGFSAVTARVRGRPLRESVTALIPVGLTSAPVYAASVALLAWMYVRVSPWTLALFLVPAMAAQRLYGLYQEQRQLAADLSTANKTLEEANLQFAEALIATLDARDQYTAGHSAAVAIYSRDIAQRMGLSEDVQKLAHLCGLVHDIGKIGLPPGLLEKPGALTLEERRQMEKHSAIGERILRNVDEYSEIATIVRHHHERIDGEGYPDKLEDEQIPLVSRIIAVADAYNAMTSDRPYRDAMPSRVARTRLAQAVDSQFDTAVVAAFEAVLVTQDEAYRVARGPEFRPFSHAEGESVSSRGDSVAGRPVAEVA